MHREFPQLLHEIFHDRLHSAFPFHHWRSSSSHTLRSIYYWDSKLNEYRNTQRSKTCFLHKSGAQMYNYIMLVGAGLSSSTSIQPTDTANGYDTQPAPLSSSHQCTSSTTICLNNIVPSLSSSSNWPLPNKLLNQKYYFLPTWHYYGNRVEFWDHNALCVCMCLCAPGFNIWTTDWLWSH